MFDDIMKSRKRLFLIPAFPLIPPLILIYSLLSLPVRLYIFFSTKFDLKGFLTVLLVPFKFIAAVWFLLATLLLMLLGAGYPDKDGSLLNPVGYCADLCEWLFNDKEFKLEKK